MNSRIVSLAACMALAAVACHGAGDNGIWGQAGAREATLHAPGGERAIGGGPRGTRHNNAPLAGQEPRGLDYHVAARGNGHAADVPEETLQSMQNDSAHPRVDEPGPADNYPGSRPPYSAGVLSRRTLSPARNP